MADPPSNADLAPDRGGAGHEEAIGVLVKLGVERATAAEYVRRGEAEAAVFEAVLLPDRLQRTVSPAEIASQGGLEVGPIADLMEAFGLPRPAPEEPVFTPAEAGTLIDLARLGELWPAEARVQVGRVYGAMLSAIARAELQAFQTHTQERVREQGGGDAEQLRALKSAFERLLPLGDPLLLGVHRRWIEHELGQRAVSAAEQRAGAGALPGAVDVTFLFCDLKDFTAYAQAKGDATAIIAIERFFDVIAREHGESGEFVKSLGDGAMLVYEDPAEAVAAGLRVISAMRGTELPGVHAGVHRGVAIARGGDYFGGSVNLAARLLAIAGRDELIATDEVVQACGDEFAWERADARAVRGVPSPVVVHRLVTPT